MALEDLDKDWILQQIKANTQFSQRLVGDTPTDANQLTPKDYVNTYVQSGLVSSPNMLPSGWSVHHDGTGKYTITHNIGSKNYVVCANALATGFNRDYVIVVSDYSVNSFQVNIVLSGSDADSDFFFILVRQP